MADVEVPPIEAPAVAEPTEWEKQTANFRSRGDAPVAEPAAIPEAGADGEATDGDAQAEVEGKLPPWMEKRIARANRKESEADQRAARLEAQLQETRDEVAAMKAAATAPKAPDADDFDTVAEYEAAKAKHAEAAKPAVQAQPAKRMEGLPVHIETKDWIDGVEFLITNLPKDTEAALRKVNGLSPDMTMAVVDIADGDKEIAAAVADFAIANQHIVTAIASLPARRQAAAFEKAFDESQAAKPKPKVEAKPAKEGTEPPPPRTRLGGNKPNASVATGFRGFKDQRDAEDLAAGRRPW